MKNTENSVMSPLETAKEIAKSFLKGVSEKNYYEVIEQIVDDNCTIHSLFGNLYGKLAMQRVVHNWVGGFPDLIVEQNHVIAEGDLVAILWLAKGTHQGEFRGLRPTGKPISYSGTSICRISGEKITEYWSYLDFQYLVNQIS